MLEDVHQTIRDLQQKNREQTEINRELADRLDKIESYLNFSFVDYQIKTGHGLSSTTTLAQLEDFLKHIRTGE